jgi:hypothetical protein
LLLALFLAARPSVTSIIKSAPENAVMQTAHGLAMAFFQYSVDNNGNFPDGKSSTEVFQKLIPTYLTNPDLLYLPLPRKVRARTGEPLKPENVCWDVTGGVDSTDPDGLPLVFSTGYKINYVPGESAIPLIKPFPSHEFAHRTWWQWWHGYPEPSDHPGIAIGYKDMSSAFRVLTISNAGNSVPQFVPSSVDLRGKKFRQLTPDGTLAPQ